LRPAPSFPTECWQFIHFPLLYIFGTADHKFFSVVGRFLASFVDCWCILSLRSPNPLRSGLQTLPSTTLPFFEEEKILSSFRVTSERLERIGPCTDFVCIWYGFLQLVASRPPTAAQTPRIV
jgi:hypothetical protein